MAHLVDYEFVKVSRLDQKNVTFLIHVRTTTDIIVIDGKSTKTPSDEVVRRLNDFCEVHDLCWHSDHFANGKFTDYFSTLIFSKTVENTHSEDLQECASKMARTLMKIYNNDLFSNIMQPEGRYDMVTYEGQQAIEIHHSG